MSAYLDASVILPNLIQEAASPVVESFFTANTESLVVSAFSASEVASAFSRLTRTGHLSVADAHAKLADFDGWRATACDDAELQEGDVKLAGVFVRRFELLLRTPDAIHLALCRRGGHRLITRDRRLAAAAVQLGFPTTLLG